MYLSCYRTSSINSIHHPRIKSKHGGFFSRSVVAATHAGQSRTLVAVLFVWPEPRLSDLPESCSHHVYEQQVQDLSDIQRCRNIGLDMVFADQTKNHKLNAAMWISAKHSKTHIVLDHCANLFPVYKHIFLCLKRVKLSLMTFYTHY